MDAGRERALLGCRSALLVYTQENDPCRRVGAGIRARARRARPVPDCVSRLLVPFVSRSQRPPDHLADDPASAAHALLRADDHARARLPGASRSTRSPARAARRFCGKRFNDASRRSGRWRSSGSTGCSRCSCRRFCRRPCRSRSSCWRPASPSRLSHFITRDCDRPRLPLFRRGAAGDLVRRGGRGVPERERARRRHRPSRPSVSSAGSRTSSGSGAVDRAATPSARRRPAIVDRSAGNVCIIKSFSTCNRECQSTSRSSCRCATSRPTWPSSIGS